MHTDASPLVEKSVEIVSGVLAGQSILIEDWWDRVAGRSWMDCDGHPACLAYAVREPAPLDNEVLYGKIGGFGALVHVTTLGDGS